MRVGIIGFGKVGQLREQALAMIPGVHVVGFFDPYASVMKNSLRKFPTAESLLSDDELDCAVVSTPNNLTATYVVQALEAGKDVLAEKPPGRNIDELSIIERAKKSRPSQVLMFGFNHRHKPSIEMLIGLVEAGKLGALQWVRFRYGKEFEKSHKTSWRSNPNIAGGGILLDQGIHAVDILLRLLGRFDEVQSMIGSSSPTSPVGLETNAFVQLRNTETGVAASLHSTTLQWRYMFSLEASMERGSIVLNGLRTPSGNYGPERLTIHQVSDGGSRSTVEKDFKVDESWLNESKAFAEAVSSRVEPVIGSIGHAKDVMMSLERIYRADTNWNRPTLTWER